jgi:hypothetical protein
MYGHLGINLPVTTTQIYLENERSTLAESCNFSVSLPWKPSRQKYLFYRLF